MWRNGGWSTLPSSSEKEVFFFFLGEGRKKKEAEKFEDKFLESNAPPLVHISKSPLRWTPSNQPSDRACLLSTTGDQARGLCLYLKAAALCTSSGHSRTLEYSSACTGAAQCCRTLDQLPAAQRYVADALGVLLTLDQSNTAVLNKLADAYHAQGDVFDALGRTSEALDAYENGALPCHERTGNIEGIAVALGSIGNVAETAGQYAKSYSALQRAKALLLAEPDGAIKYAPQLVDVAANTGAVLLLLRRPADALECYQSVVAAMTKMYGPRSAEVATALSNVGTAHIANHDSEAALECFLSTKVILVKLKMQSTLMYASTL